MGWIGEDQLIAEGRQIMMTASVGGFRDIQMYLRNFGGEIVFKGFPTENRNGNAFSLGSSLAITTSCVDKDGAWEFLRTLLTADWQRENVSWAFPLNRTVFDEMIVEAMTERETPGWDDGWVVTPRMPSIPGFDPDGPLTQAQVNQMLALIDSITNITDWNSSLMEIIEEGASDFFNGRGSAQDAARVIQSRASILVAEQR
jgi:ABC-type glycerol-3-phosphate transport system substrate-binding protein